MTFSATCTDGTAMTRLPMPAAHSASMMAKPTVTPSMCGIERMKPKRIPDEVSMMLFGPGVIDETKANSAKGNKGSMRLIPEGFLMPMTYPSRQNQYSTNTIHQIIQPTVTAT